MNSIHAMIDLETLGLSTNTYILEIGAIIFNIETAEVIDNIRIGVPPKGQEFRPISGNTIRWWLGQEDRRPLYDPDCFRTYDLEGALRRLSYFFDGRNIENFWARGPDFDLKVLQHAFETAAPGLELPWKYWQARDCRTLQFAARGVATPAAHISVEDAKIQVTDVCRWYSQVEQAFEKSGVARDED